jgi:hypothetical protein
VPWFSKAAPSPSPSLNISSVGGVPVTRIDTALNCKKKLIDGPLLYATGMSNPKSTKNTGFVEVSATAAAVAESTPLTHSPHYHQPR